MSRRNSNSQSCCYSDHQAHLYKTHQALQRLDTSSGTIQNQLKILSNNLLQSRLDNSDLMQLETFGNTRRSLNTSIQNVTSLTHDIAEFLQFLVPFNTPPYPLNSRSYSPSSGRVASKPSSESSNPSESPSLLNNDYTIDNPLSIH